MSGKRRSRYFHEKRSRYFEEAATSTEDGQHISIQWKRDFDDGVFPGISGNTTGPGNGTDSPPDAQSDQPSQPEDEGQEDAKQSDREE